jgi:hypothetical protein
MNRATSVGGDPTHGAPVQHVALWGPTEDPLMSYRRTMRLFSAVVIATTTALTCPSDIPSRVPNGDWGGQHIGLVVSDSGGVIDYDCATGTITQPLLLDASGNFDWRGIHIPGHGGPVRIDEPPNAHPARYTGQATADRMTITVVMLDAPAAAPQTYTLTRGGTPKVFKCL